MSEDQLYELAQKRVDRRNRRIFFLGADILAFFIFVAAFSAFDNLIPHDLGVFISVVWIGVLALHMIAMGVVQSRDGEVEREVARLRHELYDEKPKRLQLGEDGELSDEDDDIYASDDKARRDSV